MQTPFSSLPRAERGNELGYKVSLVLRIKLYRAPQINYEKLKLDVLESTKVDHH